MPGFVKPPSGLEAENVEEIVPTRAVNPNSGLEIESLFPSGTCEHLQGA